MRSRRRLVVALLAATVAVAALSISRQPLGPAEVEAAIPAAHPIVVESRPIDAFRSLDAGRTRFGALEFLGGLTLTSRDRAFGGWSALRSFDHGRRLLAVGDEGSWLSARLDTDPSGRPIAVHEATIAPLLDADRRPFRGKWDRDAESLTLRFADGVWQARVGFERHHRILAYRAATPDDLSTAPGRPVAIPSDIRRLRPNEGLEALADRPDGRLVAIAETAAPGTTSNPGWILDGGDVARFRLAAHDRFAVTDAAFAPSGDLLVLQRRIAWWGRPEMRLVRVPARDLLADRTIEPEVLLTSGPFDEIDNMEGLAVDVAPDGGAIVTLISDDNFFWLQRTVLLRFRLRDEAAERRPELTLR